MMRKNFRPQKLDLCKRSVEMHKHASLDSNIQPVSKHCYIKAVPRKYQLARGLVRSSKSVAKDESVLEESGNDQQQGVSGCFVTRTGTGSEIRDTSPSRSGMHILRPPPRQKLDFNCKRQYDANENLHQDGEARKIETLRR